MESQDSSLIQPAVMAAGREGGEDGEEELERPHISADSALGLVMRCRRKRHQGRLPCS